MSIHMLAQLLAADVAPRHSSALPHPECSPLAHQARNTGQDHPRRGVHPMPREGTR